MLRNWLRIALTNWLTHKLYAAINVFGLAIGLLCFLLIALFVHYELSYDEFFPDADSIYRISPDYAASTGFERRPGAAPAALAPFMRDADIDGVDALARFGGQQVVLTRDERVFYEDAFRWADPEFFDIFQLDWLEGSAASALDAPSSAVISESLARKLFDRTNVVGDTVSLENRWTLTITGVFADLPDNSHLSANLIVGMDTAWALLEWDYSTNWYYTNFHTYALLEEGASADSVQAALRSATEALAFPPFVDSGLDFSLHKVRDIHLRADREGEMRPAGNLGFVLTFGTVAACLLLIACINFMNLSTARASTRIREVGMRKALGAGRAGLVVQFLGEALLFTLVALVIALTLVELLLPVFSALIERPLAFATVSTQDFALLLAAITLGTWLVAGAYPAFYLSGFNPARVLKGEQALAGGVALRNVLVVVQFFLAIGLIVATLVVYLQMRFVETRELGFAHDQVVILSGTTNGGLGAGWPLIKQQLRAHPGIEQVAEADMVRGNGDMRSVRGEGGVPDGIDMLSKRVGFGFLEAHAIELVRGRYFDERLATDLFVPWPEVPEGGSPSGSYILSEAAVRALGWTPETALGKNFEMDFSSDFSVTVPGPVIGVVEDIHLQSLREPIVPVLYYVPGLSWGPQNSFASATLHLGSGDIGRTLADIDALWREHNPGMPLSRRFLDADIEARYQGEKRQGQLFTLFALLTIGLACLGLFGLASYTVERRRKEIGVRKVLGGSAWRIVMLLTNDFSKLVLVANLLAWPVAYVAMESWLENFAYRIDLTPLIFIGSGLIALSIAWATVGGTAAKAASAKPVLALRYE